MISGLINPDCKDWTQFSDPSKADTSSVSSESVDDVWCITDEQREYYIRQFKLMQEDVRGVISGQLLLRCQHFYDLIVGL
jgi:hypothetical protein